jgi:hypothetical protein
MGGDQLISPMFTGLKNHQHGEISMEFSWEFNTIYWGMTIFATLILAM